MKSIRARPFNPRLLLACALALALPACARKQADAPATRARLEVREEIHRLLDREDSTLHAVPDSTDEERAWVELREFYARRKYKPAWSSGRKLRREALDFREVVRRARRLGLRPADYGLAALDKGIATLLRAERFRLSFEPALAGYDVRATEGALRLARDVAGGRAPSRVLDPDWTHGRDSTRVDEAVLEAIDKHRFEDELARLETRHQGYRRLRSALEQHLEAAAHGGWPVIPPGARLQAGDRGPRVASLVRRLAATGDLKATIRDTVFDARVARAVGDFQSRHGIPRSGVVGEVTRLALNVPVEERIRQIGLNLERWRWLPADLGARYLAVNLPAYRLDVMHGDTIVTALRAVVGKRKSPTPVFSDAVTYIEFNPTWTVPRSIIVHEIVPLMKRHPDYLEKNHMRVVSWTGDRSASLDPDTIPWRQAGTDTFPYLVIADSSPDNPLGRIKFMCPNEYDVYLHDSPQRDRFTVSARDFSHGCVRVAEPEALADSLLGWGPGDSLSVDSLVKSGTWKRVSLRKPLPVHFLYWTAWVDDSSRVQFRDDLYGLDARLDSALVARRWDTFQLNPGVEVSPLWLAARARAEKLRADRLRAAAAAAQRRTKP